MFAFGLTRALLVSVLVFSGLLLLFLSGYESFPDVQICRPFRIQNATKALDLSPPDGDEAPASPDSHPPSSSQTSKGCPASVIQLRDTFARRWGIPLPLSLAQSGTGARVRRAMERLQKERKLTIGILGGSITFGHGLKPNEKRYAELIEEGLRQAFPDAEIMVKNGAVAATGTDYFSACYKHHVPEDADLFILESAVNDLMVDINIDKSSVHQDIMTDTETLVRELLGGEAAVLMLSTWGMTNGYINGADQHATVAEYYDVPRLSTRAALYQYVQAHLENATEIFVPGDMGHYNPNGHRFMADSILDYLLGESCKPSYAPPYSGLRGTGLSSQLDPFALPRLRIRQRLNQEQLANPVAFCKSANVQLGDGSWQLMGLPVDAHPSFEKVVWHDKHYWAAEEIGARVTFTDIDVSGGFLGLYYLRSTSMGLGNLRCWADGDQGSSKLLVGYWNYVSVGSVGVIATGLAPGKHNVTCEVDKTTNAVPHPDAKGSMHKTRIIAVIAS
ncbi:hypothetical protein CspeluHIS016_0403940 [Cutaneotrichosporon spelunceum]|uniref:SGNH hydrolase-type esterase domain-containing protein n=1 Tax=Cutaneotrichosporon spelunceum TaxID=1672016 RepID=A0AAD3YBZ2_9TREE|nr:hypothetical protein CspeluHIS016_0403940 [Cutaneotrichosporon spelunceum]